MDTWTPVGSVLTPVASINVRAWFLRGMVTKAALMGGDYLLDFKNQQPFAKIKDYTFKVKEMLSWLKT